MKLLPRAGLCIALNVAACSVLNLSHSFAQQSLGATEPIGRWQVQCLGASDTLVATPLTRTLPAYAGVAAVSGNVVSLATSNLSVNQFVYNPTGSPAIKDHFYLLIGPVSASLTGTVGVTQNSATLTGAGTAFSTQLAVGDRITIDDQKNTTTYTISAITSATSLMLDRPFVDSTPGAALSGLLATFDHSPLEGRRYLVTANGSNSVTVNLNGDTFASLAIGTQVYVVPYWSLNSLFPAANAGVSFTASPSSTSLNTQILIPNTAGVGTNLPPAATYYYMNSGSNVGWRQVGDAVTTDHGNDLLLPDSHFIVRNPSGTPSLPLTFNGAVLTDKLSTALDTNTSQAQDNAVGLSRPAGAALKALGVGPADNSFQSSPSATQQLDQLLVYDNTTAVLSKAPSKTYYYINAAGPNVGWRLSADTATTDHGNDVIPAGSAIVIRKAATTSGATAFWNNSPNY